jgi:DNA-binding transcriptional ArsR family regulator
MVNLINVLKALSSEPRLRILKALNWKRLCVNVIVKKLGMTPSAVSQHLRVLKNAGLVNAEKCGLWMHYTINTSSMEKSRQSVNRLLTAKENKPDSGGNRCSRMRNRKS